MEIFLNQFFNKYVIKMNHKKSLITDIVFLILTVLNIILFHNNNALSTIIMLTLVGIAFRYFHTKEDIVFYFMGAFLGPFLEILCIKYGVWKYSNPLFLGIPLWLPFLWGFAFLIARRMRDLYFKMEHLKIHYNLHHKISNRRNLILFDFTIYYIMIILSILLWENNPALSFSLGLILLVLLTNFHYKEDLFFIFLFALLGPVVEVICVYFGAWSYGNPTILDIPIWLPLGYAAFAVIGRRASALAVNYLYLKN
ncbi:hypothetical protein BVX95_00125 [archaeon D22]|nr:hypothetical protein BVX95_00125 [archaeon D22]